MRCKGNHAIVRLLSGERVRVVRGHCHCEEEENEEEKERGHGDEVLNDTRCMSSRSYL